MSPPQSCVCVCMRVGGINTHLCGYSEYIISCLIGEVLSEAPVSVRKLSIIPENEPDPGKADTGQASHDPQRPREKDSSTSLFTVNKYSRNSSSSDSLSTSSHQTDTGGKSHKLHSHQPHD